MQEAAVKTTDSPADPITDDAVKKEAKKSETATVSETESRQVAAPSLPELASATSAEKPENSATADVANDSVSPHELLASAAGAVPSNGGIVAGSIALVCILIGLYVKKRFHGKKKKRFME